MSRRGVRLVVAALFAAAAAVAAWQYIRVEREVEREAAASAAFQQDARTAGIALMDLRAAEQAYVAAGQGLDYWSAKVASAVTSTRGRLENLKQRASSQDASARLDDTITAFGDFEKMDTRAREYARTDQRLLASDLIYADGIEMTQSVINQLDAAREAQRADDAARQHILRARQHALAGGTAGLGLFFLLLLAFAPTGHQRAVATGRAEPAAPAPATRAITLDESQARRSEPVVDLKKAADLCLDLARVSNTGQIPGLLQRASEVLGAQGIVLWIADPDGRELVATAAHGYPVSALARMGNIPSGADNATAAAYREASVHVVKGDAISNGAIVAPLVTPAGALGVMSAEIRDEREQEPGVRAVAAIIAAQLATLVGAPSSARGAREAAR